MFDGEFEAEVDAWRARGLERSLAPTGAGLIDFTSNDYLGMSRHPRVRAAAARAAEEHGAGGRAARLLGGGASGTSDLEQSVADWLGAEGALLLPSGYQANLTLLPAIAGPGDVVLSDALNHASLIDAMGLARAEVHIFDHCDVEHAASLLARTRGARRRWLVTESIFSMDGDAAPLARLADLCATEGAGLIVDEAHAVGVIGPRGAGGFAAADANRDALVARVVTGGKALGASGAFVVGSRSLMNLIVHRGRGFVFTTAVAPAVVGALAAAVELVQAAESERAIVRSHARRIGGVVGGAEPAAAIVPVPFGDPAAALKAAGTLQSEGFDVRAIRPPTVPEDGARLRVVCHAVQSRDDVHDLANALGALVGQRKPSAPATAKRMRAPAPLFVVGTDTDVGKTVVSALVARALGARYWKPVQTGADSDTETVESLAGRAADDTPRSIAPPHASFPLPASPHTAAAAAGEEIDVVALNAALEQHVRAVGTGRLVVELAGGLLVPLTEAFTQADWLARLRPDVVLVARSGLGTLNHTRLTLEALRSRRIRPRALILVGEPHAANARTLAAHVSSLFELPRFDVLDTAAIDGWLNQNDLTEVLCDR